MEECKYCENPKGMFLGMTCQHCGRPFRSPVQPLSPEPSQAQSVEERTDEESLNIVVSKILGIGHRYGQVKKSITSHEVDFSVSLLKSYLPASQKQQPGKSLEECKAIISKQRGYNPEWNTFDIKDNVTEADFISFYDEAAELYAQSQSEGWVKVEDRLPEDENMYLCYGHGQITIEDFSISYNEFWSTNRRFKVTHWMPLPQPPKQ